VTTSEAAETGTPRPDTAQTAQTAPPVTPTPQAVTEERRDEAAHGKEGPTGGKVVHLHTAHPRVPIPYVTPGDMFTGVKAAASLLPTLLPSRRKLAYYGLLGGMTVAGALEWPVAVAVGAATEVITREQAARTRAQQEEQRRQATTEPSARTTESTRPPQAAMA
jgi:hypothetical protein